MVDQYGHVDVHICLSGLGVLYALSPVEGCASTTALCLDTRKDATRSASRTQVPL